MNIRALLFEAALAGVTPTYNVENDDTYCELYYKGFTIVLHDDGRWEVTHP